MADFRSILGDDQLYFFDGGFGTLLQKRGLPSGVSPELFGWERPEVISSVHEDYLAAGADVMTTNTFGGTRFKLGPTVDVVALNRRMAEIARKVAGDRAFVAGSVGPTGLFVEPLGKICFKELVEAFKEQITGLVQGGADLILGETHFDLAEARAVAIAAREVCDLPVGVSMTFEGETCLTGSTPLIFVDSMRNLDVDIVATNCSAGPEQFGTVVRAMSPRLDRPLLCEPNAGLPELDAEGNTVFRLAPGPFAEQTSALADLGVKFLGGCCGTGPDHIRELVRACKGRTWKRPEPEGDPLVLTSRSLAVPIGFRYPGVVIGERINPTGKEILTSELQSGVFTEAFRFATEQTESGAGVLDVNVGAAMVDEETTLPALGKALLGRTTTPLCFDSTNPQAVVNALWTYPGSALVNSISGEAGRMEVLGPACRKFGAPFILLPIKGRKLPYTAVERLEIIESLLREAEDLGIPKRLIMVDVLALTVSSKSEAALHCFDTIRHCREKWGLPTVCGLSNISFGLPARELINSTFLTMAVSQGLTAFIANPNSARLMESLASAEVLMGRDPQAERFIRGYSGWTPGSSSAPASGSGPGASSEKEGTPMFRAVVRGMLDEILPLAKAAVDEGRDPFEIVDNELIPAIMDVGGRYERKEYFLPQLIQSAETLQKAMSFLEPLLKSKGGAVKRPIIIMATVEGDIHDIGKNIVCLMLKNHGFEVVDLGKDVPASRIVDEAEKRGAALIGLSALMTTTMVRMEDTVKLVRERGLGARVMLGGAVITQSFAESIGADGFSVDAVQAVKLAKELTAAP